MLFNKVGSLIRIPHTLENCFSVSRTHPHERGSHELCKIVLLLCLLQTLPSYAPNLNIVPQSIEPILVEEVTSALQKTFQESLM